MQPDFGFWREKKRSRHMVSSSGGNWLKAVARVVLLLAASGLALGACGDDTTTCDGVEVHGTCETKCSRDKCVDPTNMFCVENTCAQMCTTHTDCPVGKICYPAKTDDGTEGQYCLEAPFAKGGKTGRYEPCTSDEQCDTYHGYQCIPPMDGECKLVGCATNADCAGIGKCVIDNTTPGAVSYCEKGVVPKAPFEACTATSECDTDVGLSCVDGECRFAGCTTHADCAGLGLCSEGTDDTGKKVLACTCVAELGCGETTPAPKGQFGAKCPGKDSPTACTSDTNCPEGQGCHPTTKRCMPKCGTLGACPDSSPVCNSALKLCTECDEENDFTCLGAGAGDPDAYCAKTGCAADTDCGTGFYCGALRTSRPPCQSACGLQSSSTNCVQSADIGDGKEYSCGPISLLRHLCLRRDFCTSCETDDDCRQVPDQVCAKDSGGNKICTTLCDPQVANACPWGNAGDCDVWDSAVGVPTCSHRFGSCTGTGKSCEPCVDDAGCPTGLCTSSLINEKFCIDLDQDCSCGLCDADADCTGGNLCKGTCKDFNNACTGDASCDRTCDTTAGKCTGTNVACTGDNDCKRPCVGYCEGSPSLTQDSTCLGGGCPKTPGGATMTCYGGRAVKSQGSILYGKCYAANVNPNPTSSPQNGCWLPQ